MLEIAQAKFLFNRAEAIRHDFLIGSFKNSRYFKTIKAKNYVGGGYA